MNLGPHGPRIEAEAGRIGVAERESADLNFAEVR